MYVLGVDVGGSKTACFVSDEKGNILAKVPLLWSGERGIRSAGLMRLKNLWKLLFWRG